MAKNSQKKQTAVVATKPQGSFLRKLAHGAVSTAAFAVRAPIVTTGAIITAAAAPVAAVGMGGLALGMFMVDGGLRIRFSGAHARIDRKTVARVAAQTHMPRPSPIAAIRTMLKPGEAASAAPAAAPA